MKLNHSGIKPPKEKKKHKIKMQYFKRNEMKKNKKETKKRKV